MEKRDILIVAAVLLLSIGIRVYRSRLAKKSKGSESDDSENKSVKKSKDPEDYEPYSGK
jgi:uncharacterized membrane protein